MSETIRINTTEVQAPREDREGKRMGPPIIEDLWRSVLAHRWAILAIVAAFLIGSLVLTLLMTPEYTASARLEISRERDNITNVEGLQADTGRVDLEFYETNYALLQTRSLADRVVRALNLANNEDFFSAFGVDPEAGGLLAAPGQEGLSASGRSARMDLATDILLENLDIVPLRGSSLVDVRFTSPSPRLAAQISNTWSEQFIQSTLDRRFASTQDAREYLEDRLEQLRERLEASEQQLVAYASQAEIITLAETRDSEGRTRGEQTVVGSDLQSMNEALAQARADRVAAESIFRQRGQRAELANPAINGLRERRAEVAAQRANLLTQFESGYPAVRALTSEIEQLDRSIASEEARVRENGRAEYNSAVQRERMLAQRVDQLKNRFVQEGRDSIQYNIFQREVDTNRELYEGLLQRYKEIGVAGVGSNNIQIVDRAVIPEIPSSPNLKLNLVVGLVFGLILASLYVFMREQIDQSLRDPAEVSNTFGLPLLGAVPDVAKDDVAHELHDRKSAIWEAYQSIGTTLSFLTDHGVPKTILFTSTVPNEAKTTTAFALATVLARGGARTLLIDGDLRNPSVHRLFGISNDHGLSNVLSGGVALEDAVQTTETSGLSVLTAGPVPPSAAELLTGPRLEEMVAKASARFDHILVDAPPVLGLADVPLLVKAVHSVIFIVQANRAKMRAIRTALDRLSTAKAHVHGAVVTKLSARNASYGYGQEYGYGYGYRAEHDETRPVAAE